MATLSAEMIDFLGAGVALQVGACDRHGRPSICRALAATVDEEGKVLLLISGDPGFEVLAAIRDTGQISVVFAAPLSFRALHLKGADAQVRHAGAAYRSLLDAGRRAFDVQLVPYGFSPDYTLAWYTVPDEDLMSIRFTPSAAWNQTPGPGAGDSLELRG